LTFVKNDNDYNFSAKKVEVVIGPKNGDLVGNAKHSDTVVHYYPNEGFVGRDEIVFRSFTGSGDAKVYSEEKIVSIIVK
jgi:hypothetical protein